MSDTPRDGYGRPLRGHPHAPRRQSGGRPLNGAANLTFALVARLRAVGIDSWDRLADVGAKEAWLRLRQQDEQLDNLATLLALQGAIDDEVVTFLPLTTVDALKAWHTKHLAGEGREPE